MKPSDLAAALATLAMAALVSYFAVEAMVKEADLQELKIKRHVGAMK